MTKGERPVTDGIQIVRTGDDMFIQLMDGTRIAKRIRDGKGGGFWQSIHPNYEVRDTPDGNHIEVGYKGKLTTFTGTPQPVEKT